MHLTQHQVDAFTNHLFGGVPAAVVPLQGVLPEPVMQAIAQEKTSRRPPSSWLWAQGAFISARSPDLLVRSMPLTLVQIDVEVESKTYRTRADLQHIVRES